MSTARLRALLRAPTSTTDPAEIAPIPGIYLDLLVCVGVHEDEISAVSVQICHIAPIDSSGIHLRPGIECLVHNLAGQHILQCRPHEGAAFARFDMLEVHDRPQLAVEVEHES